MKAITNYEITELRNNEKMRKLRNYGKGFTLPEILIAVTIFSSVVTLAAGMYIQTFKETRRANSYNQIYEDARYIMSLIAQEIQNGMVDYDEYYYQNVVKRNSISVSAMDNWGQGYGRYYSAFFNPGSDIDTVTDTVVPKLGFDCNDGTRNRRGCTPLRKSADRNTGSNPFTGKAPFGSENAFCGTLRYAWAPPSGSALLNVPITFPVPPPNLQFPCFSAFWARSTVPAQSELYLISEDGYKKTILAREKIGQKTVGTAVTPVYALSLLRLTGVDLNSDGLPETFVCSSEFQCRGGNAFDVAPSSGDPRVNLEHSDVACVATAGDTEAADLPRSRVDELINGEADICDPKSNGFSKDFVPISPLRVNVKDLKFYIAPDENPHYAFGEDAAQRQPRVTVVLTVDPNPENIGGQQEADPFTLVETVTSRVLLPIPAPLLVE